MIIDSHAHIFTDDMIVHKDRYCDDKQFALLYYGKAKIANDALLIDSMQNNGVDASVALGFTWQRNDYAQRHNEYMAMVQERHKGKVYVFGAIALDTDMYQQIKNIKQMGLYGIGEVAFYVNGFTEEEETIVSNILAIAGDMELPVCLHVNEPVGHIYTGKYTTDMQRLYALLSQYTNTTVICSHWGGGLLFYELMPEVKKSLQHVYYDSAASPFLYSDTIYSIAITICGKEKILFGSDFPLLDYSRYNNSIQLLGENAQWIADQNVKKLLRLL